MGYTVEQLQAAGGKLWEKNGMRRVYFNGLQDRIGLSVARYGTGNISSASINGESISNCRAREIEYSCKSSKIWYDLSDKRFHGKLNGCRDYSSDDLFNIFVESIKSDIDKITEKPESDQKPTEQPVKYIRCKKCGQGGYAGSYPFSTCSSSGICDDCF